MTTYSVDDPRFDDIRKMVTDNLISIRLGWSGDAALQALVSEYDAAVDAANAAELKRYFKSVREG